MSFSLKRRIHDKELIRDALLGLSNLFEISEGGRDAECYACGRALTFAIYYKKGCMYA